MPIFTNRGVTPAEEELVSSGTAAGIFIGVDWITHRSWGNACRLIKALDNAPDFATLYGAPDVDPALGYTDCKEADQVTFVAHEIKVGAFEVNEGINERV
ncbi:hypothetical protein C8R44DRAFT_882949 [Mycena epipterygia]|nr:hypothetical protein C8R44DRAFT_882949 [Mycena epipterygia]